MQQFPTFGGEMWYEVDNLTGDNLACQEAVLYSPPFPMHYSMHLALSAPKLSYVINQ